METIVVDDDDDDDEEMEFLRHTQKPICERAQETPFFRQYYSHHSRYCVLVFTACAFCGSFGSVH